MGNTPSALASALASFDKAIVGTAPGSGRGEFVAALQGLVSVLPYWNDALEGRQRCALPDLKVHPKTLTSLLGHLESELRGINLAARDYAVNEGRALLLVSSIEKALANKAVYKALSGTIPGALAPLPLLLRTGVRSGNLRLAMHACGLTSAVIERVGFPEAKVSSKEHNQVRREAAVKTRFLDAGGGEALLECLACLHARSPPLLADAIIRLLVSLVCTHQDTTPFPVLQRLITALRPAHALLWEFSRSDYPRLRVAACALLRGLFLEAPSGELHAMQMCALECGALLWHLRRAIEPAAATSTAPVAADEASVLSVAWAAGRPEGTAADTSAHCRCLPGSDLLDGAPPTVDSSTGKPVLALAAPLASALQHPLAREASRETVALLCLRNVKAQAAVKRSLPPQLQRVLTGADGQPGVGFGGGRSTAAGAASAFASAAGAGAGVGSIPEPVPRDAQPVDSTLFISPLSRMAPADPFAAARDFAGAQMAQSGFKGSGSTGWLRSASKSAVASPAGGAGAGSGESGSGSAGGGGAGPDGSWDRDKPPYARATPGYIPDTLWSSEADMPVAVGPRGYLWWDCRLSAGPTNRAARAVQADKVKVRLLGITPAKSAAAHWAPEEEGEATGDGDAAAAAVGDGPATPASTARASVASPAGAAGPGDAGSRSSTALNRRSRRATRLALSGAVRSDGVLSLQAAELRWRALWAALLVDGDAGADGVCDATAGASATAASGAHSAGSGGSDTDKRASSASKSQSLPDADALHKALRGGWDVACTAELRAALWAVEAELDRRRRAVRRDTVGSSALLGLGSVAGGIAGGSSGSTGDGGASSGAGAGAGVVLGRLRSSRMSRTAAAAGGGAGAGSMRSLSAVGVGGSTSVRAARASIANRARMTEGGGGGAGGAGAAGLGSGLRTGSASARQRRATGAVLASGATAGAGSGGLAAASSTVASFFGGGADPAVAGAGGLAGLGSNSGSTVGTNGVDAASLFAPASSWFGGSEHPQDASFLVPDCRGVPRHLLQWRRRRSSAPAGGLEAGAAAASGSAAPAAGSASVAPGAASGDASFPLPVPFIPWEHATHEVHIRAAHSHLTVLGVSIGPLLQYLTSLPRAFGKCEAPASSTDHAVAGDETSSSGGETSSSPRDVPSASPASASASASAPPLPSLSLPAGFPSAIWQAASSEPHPVRRFALLACYRLLAQLTFPDPDADAAVTGASADGGDVLPQLGGNGSDAAQLAPPHVGAAAARAGLLATVRGEPEFAAALGVRAEDFLPDAGALPFLLQQLGSANVGIRDVAIAAPLPGADGASVPFPSSSSTTAAAADSLSGAPVGGSASLLVGVGGQPTRFAAAPSQAGQAVSACAGESTHWLRLWRQEIVLTLRSVCGALVAARRLLSLDAALPALLPLLIVPRRNPRSPEDAATADSAVPVAAGAVAADGSPLGCWCSSAPAAGACGAASCAARRLQSTRLFTRSCQAGSGSRIWDVDASLALLPQAYMRRGLLAQTAGETLLAAVLAAPSLGAAFCSEGPASALVFPLLQAPRQPEVVSTVLRLLRALAPRLTLYAPALQRHGLSAALLLTAQPRPNAAAGMDTSGAASANQDGVDEEELEAAERQIAARARRMRAAAPPPLAFSSSDGLSTGGFGGGNSGVGGSSSLSGVVSSVYRHPRDGGGLSEDAVALLQELHLAHHDATSHGWMELASAPAAIAARLVCGASPLDGAAGMASASSPWFVPPTAEAEAASADAASALAPLLPQPLVMLLRREGAQAFASVFNADDYASSTVLWSASMRATLMASLAAQMAPAATWVAHVGVGAGASPAAANGSSAGHALASASSASVPTPSSSAPPKAPSAAGAGAGAGAGVAGTTSGNPFAAAASSGGESKAASHAAGGAGNPFGGVASTSTAPVTGSAKPASSGAGCAAFMLSSETCTSPLAAFAAAAEGATAVCVWQPPLNDVLAAARAVALVSSPVPRVACSGGQLLAYPPLSTMPVPQSVRYPQLEQVPRLCGVYLQSYIAGAAAPPDIAKFLKAALTALHGEVRSLAAAHWALASASSHGGSSGGASSGGAAGAGAGGAGSSLTVSDAAAAYERQHTRVLLILRAVRRIVQDAPGTRLEAAALRALTVLLLLPLGHYPRDAAASASTLAGAADGSSSSSASQSAGSASGDSGADGATGGRPLHPDETGPVLDTQRTPLLPALALLLPPAAVQETAAVLATSGGNSAAAAARTAAASSSATLGSAIGTGLQSAAHANAVRSLVTGRLPLVTSRTSDGDASGSSSGGGSSGGGSSGAAAAAASTAAACAAGVTFVDVVGCIPGSAGTGVLTGGDSSSLLSVAADLLAVTVVPPGQPTPSRKGVAAAAEARMLDAAYALLAWALPRGGSGSACTSWDAADRVRAFLFAPLSVSLLRSLAVVIGTESGTQHLLDAPAALLPLARYSAIAWTANPSTAAATGAGADASSAAGAGSGSGAGSSSASAAWAPSAHVTASALLRCCPAALSALHSAASVFALRRAFIDCGAVPALLCVMAGQPVAGSVPAATAAAASASSAGSSSSGAGVMPGSSIGGALSSISTSSRPLAGDAARSEQSAVNCEDIAVARAFAEDVHTLPLWQLRLLAEEALRTAADKTLHAATGPGSALSGGLDGDSLLSDIAAEAATAMGGPSGSRGGGSAATTPGSGSASSRYGAGGAASMRMTGAGAGGGSSSGPVSPRSPGRDSVAPGGSGSAAASLAALRSPSLSAAFGPPSPSLRKMSLAAGGASSAGSASGSGGSFSLYRTSAAGSFAAAAAERSVRRAAPSHEHLQATSCIVAALCAILSPWAAYLCLPPSVASLSALGAGSAAGALGEVDAADAEAVADAQCGGARTAIPLLHSSSRDSSGGDVKRGAFVWNARAAAAAAARIAEEMRGVDAAHAAGAWLQRIAGTTQAGSASGSSAGGASSAQFGPRATSAGTAAATVWSADKLQAADAYKAVFAAALSGASSNGAGASAAASPSSVPAAAPAGSARSAAVSSSAGGNPFA